MLKRIFLLLWMLPLFAQAQVAVTNSSFSNGGGTGSDGIVTVKSRFGSPLMSIAAAVMPPTVAASGITFSGVLSASMTVTFTAGNGSKRLAIIKAGGMPGFIPVDDTFYSGDLGNGEHVVYSGSGNSFGLSQLLPSTTYFITVYEFNTVGTSVKYLTAGAPFANHQTLALPVVYVTSPANAAVNQNANLNITSRAVSGATVYTIEISADPAFTIRKVRSGGRTLNFDSLQYNTLYFTRVKTDLRADYGQVTTFSTKTAESLAFVTSPVDNATNVTNTLNITSSNVLYASEYTIQLSETQGFSVIAFEQSGPTRTLAFAGLKYNTQYYSRVLTNLTDTYSAVRTFTTRSAESLAYVSAPSNGAVNVKTSLDISSKNVPGANSYTIQLSETIDFAIVAFEVTGPTRTLAFSGLKYNTTYYNRVSTDLSAGFGLINSFTTRTAESITYVVTPADGSMGKNLALSVSSSNVPGATSYTIQLSESPIFAVVAFESTAPTASMVFTGLKYGTTYHNRVITDLTSVYGPVRSFTTKTAESIAFVTTPSNGAVGVSVNPLVKSSDVPGAVSYTIQLSTVPDFSTVAFESTGASRTKTFAGLTAGTTYYNRVGTDLSTEFGTVRSFTTAGVAPPGRIRADVPLVQADAEIPAVTEFDVRVYPNPFREKLTVYVESAGQEADLTLTDMAGRSVYQARERTNRFIEVERPLSAGIYLLHVWSGHETKVVRVIKIE